MSLDSDALIDRRLEQLLRKAKPCPFCGRRDVALVDLHMEYVVVCDNCASQCKSVTGLELTMEILIECFSNWNTRYPA